MATTGDYDVGVDIGGTFTDIVCREAQGGVRLVKIPTTRRDPSEGVRAAMGFMRRHWNVEETAIRRFVHGTTVATNAVLERKGARVGLLTTAGFKDVLEIGRQMRRSVYSLELRPETPGFLIPGGFRKEVDERISEQGEVLIPLDPASVEKAVDELVLEGVECIAVCLLFSFINPAHELQIRDIIRSRRPELMVSLSCEVDPAFREYERTCATAFDAYVKPVVDRYLSNMENNLAAGGVKAPLQIMHSRGGITSSPVARRRPVRLFVSGPAAGVRGGVEIGRRLGIKNLITVDIGGTSCDISLVSGGEPMIRSEGNIAGYSVRVPMVDVTAIGSGGGSIARVDAGGTLRVGSESAGSDPGPACYDRGGREPTVTDASLVLGYIDPDYFANGSVKLVPKRAREVIERKVAEPLGLTTEQAALGIHRVLNAQMSEAIRLVSIGRGIDPRGYTLVPLGGGGGLHAVALAKELGIRSIAVPPHPGVLAAAGLLSAPIEHEVSASFTRKLDGLDWGEVLEALARLDSASAELMRAEGVAPDDVERLHQADVCFVGQSYHLEILIDAAAADPIAVLYRDFLTTHDRIYGHGAKRPARIVNLRAVHRGRGKVAERRGVREEATRSACKGERRILVDSGERVTAPIYNRHALAIGEWVEGPAILEQPDTTTLVSPGWRGLVAEDGVLLLESNEGLTHGWQRSLRAGQMPHCTLGPAQPDASPGFEPYRPRNSRAGDPSVACDHRSKRHTG